MSRPRDRAQLLLVGGLVIAVALVALAIVLNSGIYTHNLASRADPTASEAVGHTAVVRDSVDGLIEYEVRHNPDDPAEQVENVAIGVSNVSAQVSRASARRGVLTNATVTATTNGTTVNQTGDRNFTNSTTATDWEVVDDAEEVRAFRMNVIRTSLDDHDGVDFGSFTGNEFNVTLDPDSGDSWTVSVYQNAPMGVTNLTVTNTSSGQSYGPCTVGGSRAEIDVTGATVGGTPCDALRRLDDLSGEFDVKFDDADNVVGSYSLVADRTANIDGNDVTAPGNAGPSELDTLYAVWVEISFQSQRVNYRTNVTIAPGAFDG